MKLVEKIEKIWSDQPTPFLISKGEALSVADITTTNDHLSQIKQGDVVALIGDFDSVSIASLLHLIDLGAIVMPLSTLTFSDHDYFFEAGMVQFVVNGQSCIQIQNRKFHQLLSTLRSLDHAGLILFSTGPTGRPKAILHDMSNFLRRYDTVRPALKTLSFLLFDHIGGINTLFHTLFNKGMIVSPIDRSVSGILSSCEIFSVELLPTTPTFLRMMLMSGLLPAAIPQSLKVVTYGTERMDQITLNTIADLLPQIDFRQTYGMSELGILRVKSASRNSLYMSVGGEGVETRINSQQTLEIKSDSRMLGYLNAPSPFSEDGWYDTKDIVTQQGNNIRITGRTSEFVNVGGLKFMLSEVELVVLGFPGVDLVTATARDNPITGQHVELTVQPHDPSTFEKEDLSSFIQENLQPHMRPMRIRIGTVPVGHRFKKK